MVTTQNDISNFGVTYLSISKSCCLEIKTKLMYFCHVFYPSKSFSWGQKEMLHGSHIKGTD